MNCIPCLRGEEHVWHDDGTWNDEAQPVDMGPRHEVGFADLSPVKEEKHEVRYADLGPKGRR